MSKKQLLKKSDSKGNSFNKLLYWLDEDTSVSAKLYRSIHGKLIMFFAARGCAEAEDLADITIDRVAEKVANFSIEIEGNKLKYFFGFAKNIYNEYLRNRNLQINEEVFGISDFIDDEFEESVSVEKEKLKACLQKMKRKERVMILKYYNVNSGREKENRNKLAKQYKISANSLRVKIFRLKQILTECVENVSNV